MGVLTSIVLTEVMRADGPNVGDKRSNLSKSQPICLPMTSSHPSSEDFPENLLQLISAEIDGELSPEETEELRKLEATYPAQAQSLRKQWAALGAGLRGLPVKKQPSLIFQATSSVVTPVSRGHRGGQIAVATVIVSMALGLLIMMRPPKGESQVPEMARTEAAPAFSEGRVSESGAELLADASAMPSDVLMAPSAAASVMEGVSGEAGTPNTEAFSNRIAAKATMNAAPSQVPSPPLMAAAAGSGAGTPSVSQDNPDDGATRLKNVLERGNWNVVVLRAPEALQQTAVKKIESVCQDHGLTLASRPGSAEAEDSVERFGVVLTSSEAGDQEAIVAELEKALNIEEKSTDLPSLSKMSQPEIAAAVRRSLESPTQSELFQGNIHIAAPDHSDLVKAARELLKSDADQKKAAEATDEAPTSPIVSEELTLVVIEFPMPSQI